MGRPRVLAAPRVVGTTRTTPHRTTSTTSFRRRSACSTPSSATGCRTSSSPARVSSTARRPAELDEQLARLAVRVVCDRQGPSPPRPRGAASADTLRSHVGTPLLHVRRRSGAVLPLRAARSRPSHAATRRSTMSGGAQIRDYQPVAEVAAALVDLAAPRSRRRCRQRVLRAPDLGSRQVEAWIVEHGWDIEPRLGVHPYPEHEPMSFWGDPSKLRSVLGRS